MIRTHSRNVRPPLRSQALHGYPPHERVNQAPPADQEGPHTPPNRRLSQYDEAINNVPEGGSSESEPRQKNARKKAVAEPPVK